MTSLSTNRTETLPQMVSDDQRVLAFERWLTCNPSAPLPPKALPDARLALARAEQSLTPATEAQIVQKLTPCLAQCAATGMTEDDRTEWYHSALLTLRGIPLDLLDRGAEVARKFCDHPSKIVPTIMREVETPWSIRRSRAGEISSAIKRTPAQGEPEAPCCAPEEAEEIRRQYGIGRAEQKAPLRDFSRLRKPTAQDYVDLGLSQEEAEAAVASLKAHA